MGKVESFSLDHTKVIAPYVRECCRMYGAKGDLVQKFDIRFIQPNKGAIPTGVLHAMEHIMAYSIRKTMGDAVIDLSPMGCRTGFYLTVWGEKGCSEVIASVKQALYAIIKATEVPASNEKECGNYRDLSLFGAKEYAKELVEKVFIMYPLGTL